VASKADSSLFIVHQGTRVAYILLYVDDIILTANSDATLTLIIVTLRREFHMTDLGPLAQFIGIHVTHNQSGLFQDQTTYAHELLDRAGMTNCNPVSTPIDTKAKLSASSGTPLDNPSIYRSLAGALQYLTHTRPNISHVVQQACLFMHSPRYSHMSLLKRILGLQLTRSSSTSIIAYTDADWAGCPDTRRSTSGYRVFLGDNPIAWSSKRQSTVSRSSAEAEYRGVANVVAEVCWLQQLLTELHHPTLRASVVFYDNVSAMYLSNNPVQHQHAKHIEIDLHFVRDRVALGDIKVLHVPSSFQYADIFTKGLPTLLFQDFRSSLHVLARTD
jgi:hypothetical protein